MSEFPRFVSDVMLGSLAKWLRILGFDTLYFKSIEDSELVRIAGQQHRILLTRDMLLAKRKKLVKCIFIHSNDTFEQVKEVLMALDDRGYRTRCIDDETRCEDSLRLQRSRCAECNGALVPAGRESVANVVPEYVLLNRDSFFRCRDCGKVYWDGSHKKSIDEKIRKILGEAGWLTLEKD